MCQTGAMTWIQAESLPSLKLVLSQIVPLLFYIEVNFLSYELGNEYFRNFCFLSQNVCCYLYYATVHFFSLALLLTPHSAYVFSLMGERWLLSFYIKLSLIYVINKQLLNIYYMSKSILGNLVTESHGFLVTFL